MLELVGSPGKSVVVDNMRFTGGTMVICVDEILPVIADMAVTSEKDGSLSSETMHHLEDSLVRNESRWVVIYTNYADEGRIRHLRRMLVLLEMKLKERSIHFFQILYCHKFSYQERRI